MGLAGWRLPLISGWTMVCGCWEFASWAGVAAVSCVVAGALALGGLGCGYSPFPSARGTVPGLGRMPRGAARASAWRGHLHCRRAEKQLVACCSRLNASVQV